MTQMNLSTKQRQSYRYGEQACGCRGGVGDGWVGSLGLANAIFYTEEINNKVLPHSTRYNIQYPVISCKNIKKNIYRYN